MKIEYCDLITRRDVQLNPHKLFVFGDNFYRKGLNGQAKEMRGEFNSVGIPTKRFPKMSFDAFLNDGDVIEWIITSAPNIALLFNYGGIIVWPSKGIGTGLARLDETSPVIFSLICQLENCLKLK